MNKQGLIRIKRTIQMIEEPELTLADHSIISLIEALLEEDKEELTKKYDDTIVSLCPHCLCGTHTIINENKIGDFCGKCGKDKSKEKEKEKPQHKPTKENLGFELRYNGIIVKPLYLALAFKAYKNNNWFPTRELAEKQRDKNQAIARVKEYIAENFGVFEPDWGDEDEWKYEFGYSHARDILEEGAINTFKYYSPIGYLKSENNAKQLMKDCKEDLETIYK